jgi:hypothetical protein
MSENSSSDSRRHHHRSDAPPWIVGGILIVIGVYLLLQNVTGLGTGNWWALFILIPAIGSLAQAWRLYQVSGQLTEAVIGPAVGGVILLFVFAMLFFGFNWGLMWPVLLILAGIGALVGVFARR